MKKYSYYYDYGYNWYYDDIYDNFQWDLRLSGRVNLGDGFKAAAKLTYANGKDDYAILITAMTIPTGGRIQR